MLETEEGVINVTCFL